MTKDETVNESSESITKKRKRRGRHPVLLIFILVFCGGCLLSILAHPIIAHLDTQKRIVAEICIGETYYFGDPIPIKRQGVWVASPFLPDFSGGPISYTANHKLICGVVPWSPRLPYFTMLMIYPFGIYPR
jgi:hypothetical protein